jgi:hypothetical protein
MKEDFKLQPVFLRISRNTLCAFAAKIGHEGTKAPRKLLRKGYLVSTLAGDLPKSNFLCVAQNYTDLHGLNRFQAVSFVA